MSLCRERNEYEACLSLFPPMGYDPPDMTFSPEKTATDTLLQETGDPQNPVLYPVVALVTGTTPNGGGIWKYVLHKHEHGLMRHNRPILMQALHFLDFGVSPGAMARWRRPSVRQQYNTTHEYLDYKGAIFADSGGFTLMFDPELDLEKYGMPSDKLPESILNLQMDYGANIVASLDYPIPPNLAPEEAQRRQKLSLKSALETAQAIENRSDRRRKPKFYVPIHGQTPDDLRSYVGQLYETLDRNGLLHTVHGLALGSMVPRRKGGRVAEVLEFTQAAVEMAGTYPVHVFGVTGSLMPHLVHAGVSSFDTSTYIQAARTLKYFDPQTRRGLSWKHLPAYPCRCRICQGRDIEEDRAIMEGRAEGQKSMVYAAIALHNLEIEDQLLRGVKKAKRQGNLEQFIEELPQRFPAMRLPRNLKPELPRAVIKQHSRGDYDVRLRKWSPAPDTSILLLIPCAQQKPYTSSKSFQRLWKYLSKNLTSGEIRQLDVVFISGLYGPVPIKDVEEDAVMTYDFLLNKRNSSGIGTVAQRLDAFLDTHSKKYRKTVAYINQLAYREIVKRVQHHQHDIALFPTQGRMDQTAFYREENLLELAQAIKEVLSPDAAAYAAD